MQLVSKAKSFGGEQRVYRHRSEATRTDMDLAVFLPREALEGFVCPTLVYLSGLTCSWQEITMQGLPQMHAAKHGMIFVAPDTSPRGEQVPDDEHYDLGQSASFYIDSTEQPWSEHFQMESYLTKELPGLLLEALPVDEDAIGITGHSMGGFGALMLALRHPELFHSVSAFAPICNPTHSVWGRKAFEAYLGEDESVWEAYDPCLLVQERGWEGDILIDQGLADEYFEDQLEPWAFEKACRKAGVELTLRLHGGYDHYYHFIASFLADHFEWHADRLAE
ncbi:S-formylglutathione hydrolase [uncultured Cohaesibacter sp.]|uniref:S-formylglutathione hydrolase n=1 Tax=uncultured Cohaesibacter sp. TaxID=1002546 RepID=UPI00292CB269|nr:S-formylglutathione hydrolase [uncultured Cohaesibacter sp.]